MYKLQNLDEKYVFSNRIEKLYSDLLVRVLPNRMREDTHTNPDVDGKEPFLDVFDEMQGEAYDIKLAHAIVRSWLETEPKIYKGDIILGVTRPQRFVYEHFSWGITNQIWNNELKNHPKYKDKMPEVVEKMDRLYARDMQQKDMNTAVSPRMTEIFGEDTDTSGLMWVAGYQGHTVPSYPLLLSLGIDGAKEKVKEFSEVYKDDEEKRTLYMAMLIILNGFSEYCEMYADAAEKSAETDEENKYTYLTAAENCRSVAHKAPETLGEAVQLMWFYCLWDWCDCVGRLDQYMYPFYVKECNENGDESAEDYICALWLKLFENGIHNVTLAGQKPNGDDATNELTYLLLSVCRTCHQTHPRVSVRFHDNSPENLMNLVVKMWSEGMSDPTLASDNNVIKGLTQYGVSIDDARDYTILGCQEVEIPGKSNFGCEDGIINLAKLFEYTLNNGKNSKGQLVGIETGDISDFTSVDELFQAYKKQIEYFVPVWAELTNYGVDIRNANRAKLVKSIFTDSCIERGLNLDDSGSVYNFGVCETAGSSAVADSFTAIEKVVFNEKKFDMATLKSMLDCDYNGYEYERKLLRDAPKFGNDDDRADYWCHRVLDMFWSTLGKFKSRRGDVFFGACSLLEGGIEFGKQTGALPDGRHAGEPLSNTIGPREGNDINGVTSMLKSVSKLPLEKGVGGTTLNVLLPADTLDTDVKRKKIEALMNAFMKSGGQLAQITTANVDDLIDAKEHPECHRDLIVRVGGFSIEFVQLRSEAQDEIISRYV